MWILLGSVFLISFSLITFEIILSRILSVLLSYHYVFIVLSLALLGLGMGGMGMHFFRLQKTDEPHRLTFLAFFTSLFSLMIPISLILIIQVGYIHSIRENMLCYGILLFIPFFFAGVILSEVYRMFPSISAKIYGVDLVGAAAGSLGVIQLLDQLGGIRASFLLGFISSIAALLFAMGEKKKSPKGWILSAGIFLTVSFLFMANLMGFYQPDLPIGVNPAKEIHDVLYGSFFKGKIIETRWSAFGRTDLLEFSNDPDHMDIYIDGTAGSPMYRFGGKFEDPGSTIDNLKHTFPGYFPFFHMRDEERNHALIIGPGGGRDILLALMGEVQKVTAVEINQDLVDLVRKYSKYNGGIYKDLKNVSIIVDEGRNFLKRQKEKYDMIMLSLPVTNTSRSIEGYSLTENFLFTVESIHDYLDHLTDEGRLMVVGHDDVEILRLLSISLSALNQRGISHTQAMSQIYIVSSDTYLLFVLKKTSLEPTEVSLGYQAMLRLKYDQKESYFPYIKQVGTLNPVLMALGSGKITYDDLENLVKKRGYDISPVTDNSPFFYKFENGLPKPVLRVFWSSIILLLLMILVPSLYWKRRATQTEIQPEKKYFNQILLKFIFLFSLLGMGFMLIEISFIQRFILFLGQPVLSLTVLLFSLLGGVGLGSLWSGRFALNKLNKAIGTASLFVAVMVVSYTFLLPLVFDQLLGLDINIRLLVTIFLLVPLGFLMGLPFPLGIRSLKERNMQNDIPWMWGINGLSSVLGSVVTIVVAISFGFTEALLVSAGCYFIVFLIFLK